MGWCIVCIKVIAMTQKTIQTKCPALLRAMLVCAVSLLGACSQTPNDSPDGYNLNKPQTVELGKVLNEISGIAWDDKTKSIVAVSDSKEKVIQINLKSKKLKDLTGAVIPKDSDTEDIVISDSAYYLLSSWGEIRKVSIDAKDTGALQRFSLPLSGKNDFETMYYDPTVKGLVIICKSCSNEKGRGTRTAYRFDLAKEQFDSVPLYTVSRSLIEEQMKDKNADFDPSAAAIHPVSKRLFILSSAGQLLVVTDNRGNVIESYKLNPDKFPQAEGIAFAPNGDMYISNEGKYGKPTLLFFPYGAKGKKTK
jgi:uncharacterized protein YjiK